MGALRNLCGQRFGKLIVLEQEPLRQTTSWGSSQVCWVCVCDCGTQKIVPAAYLLSGDTKSCGCGQGHRETIDERGHRYGRLIVLDSPPICAVSTIKRGRTSWHCACDCGQQVIVEATALRSGETQSCGCLARERLHQAVTTHGKSRTVEFAVWQRMLRRCHCKTSDKYKYYGGRGIAVCPEWRNSFEQFLADVGFRPSPAYSLERVDNSKGYEKGNVIWADRMAQANNKRSNRRLTYQGRTQTMAQWARDSGLTYATLQYRLTNGWPLHEALTYPPRQRFRPRP